MFRLRRAPIAAKGFAERLSASGKACPPLEGRHTAISSCAIGKAVKGIAGRREASPFAAIGLTHPVTIAMRSPYLWFYSKKLEKGGEISLKNPELLG